jgi:hypothetical protein
LLPRSFSTAKQVKWLKPTKKNKWEKKNFVSFLKKKICARTGKILNTLVRPGGSGAHDAQTIGLVERGFWSLEIKNIIVVSERTNKRHHHRRKMSSFPEKTK